MYCWASAGSHFCYLYTFLYRSDCIIDSGYRAALVSLSRPLLYKCVGIIRSGLPPIFGFAKGITPLSR